MSAAELEGGDWIRGITIRQPWATCILAGKSPREQARALVMACSRYPVRVDQALCVEDMSSTLH
ncbi:hypothetical protein ACFWVB_36845 [Streptomyces microflavus]|uniref:hypothetical protein n=1 Tax=Streptomyces microflavus TaxID=1919 RepID=UPI0036672228